jgi:hypothetical protein
VPAAGPADEFAPLFGAAHPSRPRRTGTGRTSRARGRAGHHHHHSLRQRRWGSDRRGQRAAPFNSRGLHTGHRSVRTELACQSIGGRAARARRVGWASRAPTPGPGTASAEPSHVCTADLAMGNESCYREQICDAQSLIIRCRAVSFTF